MNKRVHGTICLPICLTLVVGILLPMELSAQGLQRMFSTPATRAELDRRRIRLQSGIGIDEPQEAPIEIPVFTEDEEVEIVYALGGSMRKSDGSYTVWINDVAYDQGNLPGNMELLSPFSQGRLHIRDAESGANYEVKPGQVLNLTTGQLYESYQYQAVLDAAAAEASRLATEEAMNARDSATGSAILDSAAVENLLDSAQDL